MERVVGLSAAQRKCIRFAKQADDERFFRLQIGDRQNMRWIFARKDRIEIRVGTFNITEESTLRRVGLDPSECVLALYSSDGNPEHYDGISSVGLRATSYSAIRRMLGPLGKGFKPIMRRTQEEKDLFHCMNCGEKVDFDGDGFACFICGTKYPTDIRESASQQ